MVAFDVQMLSRSLIGGREIEEFNCEVRERRAAKFAAAIPLEQLTQLCSLPKLESLLQWEAIPILYVDVFDGGHLRKLADVQKKSGKSALTAVADSFRRGSTIRVRDIDKFDAGLNHFVGEVQRSFLAQSQINVYLTPPNKSGFPPHFDITDVFIVQCLGRKEWKIFQDYSDKTELPLMETNWDPDRFKPSAPGEAITLCPGDVLYMPRGVMHQAYCTQRESMHLTISIVPLTFTDLIAKALKLAAESDIEFRRRVPWSIDPEDSGSEELVTQVKNLISKLADRIEVAGLLRAERSLFQGEPESGPSGELEAAIASLVESGSESPGVLPAAET
jgi:Cupin superfamily protein